MTPEQLSHAIVRSLEAMQAAGALGAGELPTEVVVERPKSREHGDWATNIAMQMAKPAGLPPRVIAEALATELRQVAGVTAVDIAGPGFINITLDAGAAGELARTIVAAGAGYGQGSAHAGEAINIEFISANPTGPIHLGHTRWAAVGDAIARVLEAAGARVAREFYINDRGAQMDKFGASVLAAAHGRPIPEDGYHGSYIADLAAEIVANDASIVELPEDDQLIAFREAAYTLQLKQQQDVLAGFNTVFDVWYSERSLHDSGAVERGFEQLRAHGKVFEQDGAVWLRTTDFDDDKDRVMVRSNGELTYFASDTAYYVDKQIGRAHV